MLTPASRRSTTSEDQAVWWATVRLRRLVGKHPAICCGARGENLCQLVDLPECAPVWIPSRLTPTRSCPADADVYPEEEACRVAAQS